MLRAIIIAALISGLAAAILGNMAANYLQAVLNEHPRFRFLSRPRKLLLFLILFILFSVPSIYMTAYLDSMNAPLPVSTATPTDTVLATRTPDGIPPGIVFNFEKSIDGWTTSEGDYKLAELALSSEITHSGTSALRLNTELFADSSDEIARHGGSDVYHQTEVTAYLNRAVPDGREGGYDLSGKSVSCFVFVPKGLLDSDNHAAYVQLFVKDAEYHNHFSLPLDITSSRVDTWLQLSMTVGLALLENPPDAGFDPTHINAIGIRLETASGSSLAYTGPVYIDDCVLKYP